MRRIDVIAISLVLLVSGWAIYWLFQTAGIDSIDAGILSQGVLVFGLLIWISTYLYRVATHKMTYNKQREIYEESVLQDRLEKMSPEELAQLQAELEKEEKI